MNCSWCLKELELVAMPDGYQVCHNCKSDVEKYYHCKVCDGNLNEYLAQSARRQFERKICGAECQRLYDVQCGKLCCYKGQYMNCVCAYAVTCPEHGEKHVGTHD